MSDRNQIYIEKAKKYLLRNCGSGSECACTKAKKVLAAEKMEIEAGAMSVFMEGIDEEDKHVNKLPFQGVLLVLNQASTKPPHGSRGHRIYVAKDVAEKHLDELIGMALNYAPPTPAVRQSGLDSHETRHKVGVITKAWIKGNKVYVSGGLWAKDFPEAVKDLKRRGIGLSMELADVYVRDEDESVWHLEDFTFTGMTALLKSAAAYYDTSFEIAAASKALAAARSKRALDERRLAAGIKAGVDSAMFVMDIHERLGKNLGFITLKETSQ